MASRPGTWLVSERGRHRSTPAQAGTTLLFRSPLGRLPLVQELADAPLPDPGPEDLVEVAVLLTLGRRHALQSDLQDPGGRRTGIAAAAGIVGAAAGVADGPPSGPAPCRQNSPGRSSRTGPDGRTGIHRSWHRLLSAGGAVISSYREGSSTSRCPVAPAGRPGWPGPAPHRHRS